MIKNIALLLAANLYLLLIILFVSWGSNPAEWKHADRYLVVTLVTLVNGAVIGYRAMTK